MTVLPPGVSASDFAETLRMFEAAVGKDWVFSSDEDLRPYRDFFSPAWDTPEESVPGAAVAPASVEEVQGIVRAANRHKVPLFPISTGKNFAYGGPAPNLRGTVVLDLKRLNRVLKVDDARNFALVEPGVSYLDLYHYIQERGLKVWVDCPDPGWGSPVGNSLDHGIGYTMGYFRDHFGSHCGMEVVLANGEVMRTGTGAMPAADTWQDFQYGYGPSVNGLFGQANFGIVTKMGFSLFPQPEHYRNGLITVPRRRDFIELVKAVNYLTDSYLAAMPGYGSPLQVLMRNQDFRATVTKRGGPSDAEMDKFAADNNLHSWSVFLQFYGPEPVTAAHWEYSKQLVAGRIAGARAIDGESLKVPLTQEQIHSAMPFHEFQRRNVCLGVPSMGIWSTMGRSARDPQGKFEGIGGFIPVIPRTGEAVFEFQRVMGDAMRDLQWPGFGTSAVATPVNWHPFAFQMGIIPQITRDDPAFMHKLNSDLFKLMDIAAEHGWADYRAAPLYQDTAADGYSFGNYSLRRFNESLKDAVDPNGILAPGRGGIWPQHLRHLRGQMRRKFA
jgi:4-cresol dehydrogenase (hydroxylating)